MTWQRRAQIGIALFIAGFIAVVVLAIRRPPAPAPDDSSVGLTDKDALAETTGGLVQRRVSDGKFIYTLRAETERIYPEGRAVYTDASLELPDRGGRTVTVRANRVEVSGRDGTGRTDGKEVGAVTLQGDVRLVTDDGLDMRSEDATYASADGILTIPGAVSFTRGRMSGTGVGATYDENRDVVWLLDQAKITVSPDAAGEGGLESTSGAAGLARGDHYAVLTRGAQILASGRDLQADDITIRMTPDNERVRALELRVNSRITGGTGAADAMSARDIDLHYDEDGRTLRRTNLVDNAVVGLPGAGAGPGRRVAGRTIDIEMSPDGSTVTSLRAADAVQLDLPAEPGVPARRISARTLDASGPAGAGLQAATFAGEVEYRETGGGPPAIDRTARSARLVVRTAPNLGAIQQADFRGNVHVVDAPGFTARAPRILYHAAANRMDLSPGEGDAGPEPEVTDGRATVKARTIDVDLATRGMIADTGVRSTLLPQPEGGGAAKKPAADGQRLPAMLARDQPVFVTSNHLEYDGATAQAVYTGDATLWQDKTRIQGDTLELDETAGNLTARSSVRTVMYLTDEDPKTRATTVTETRGWAQTFVYDDAKRMATYTTDARITGAQGDLKADRIELFLAKTASDLERLEAYGAVSVKEGIRTARGTRLTYTAPDDQYVMTGEPGTPVVIIENKPTGCEKSIGSALTFRRAVEQMTLTTPESGLKCTAEDQR